MAITEGSRAWTVVMVGVLFATLTGAGARIGGEAPKTTSSHAAGAKAVAAEGARRPIVSSAARSDSVAATDSLKIVFNDSGPLEITVDVATGSARGVVDVRNPDTNAVTVRLSVSTLVNGSGHASHAAVSIEPATLVVPPNQWARATMYVLLTDTLDALGVYTGTLSMTVLAKRHGSPASERAAKTADERKVPATTMSRQLRVTLEAIAPGKIALPTTWMLEVVRDWPFRSDSTISRGGLVPFPGAKFSRALAETRAWPASVVIGPRGAIAHVWWTGKVEERLGGLPSAVLALSGVSTAGDYAGQLRLGVSSDAPQIPITVRLTDRWIWPFGALILGIVIATAFQRYTTAERTKWQLRSRIEDLPTRTDSANQVFGERLGKGRNDTRYSIVDAMSRKQGDLLTLVDELDGGLVAPLDETSSTVMKLRADLQIAEVAIANWPDLGKDIKALRLAMAQIQHACRSAIMQDLAAKQLPYVLRTARETELGGPHELADVPAARLRVQEMTRFAETWADWADQAQIIYDGLVTLRKRVARLSGPMRVTAHATVDEIARLHKEAAIAIWETREQSQLTPEGSVGKPVIEAAKQLDSATLDVDAVAIADGTVLAVQSRQLSRASAAGAAPQRAVAGASRALRTKRRIGVYDVTFGAVALLVAAMTGMNVLYIGKPFGTLSDYSATVLWGFGTRAGLEALTSVAGRLFSRG